MQEANFWLGGQLTMRFGKTNTFELEANADVYASVPGLPSILKSVFLDEWNILMQLKVLGIVRLHFTLFGQLRTISLDVGKADINAYASLGGQVSRRWCGENANPPGMFTSVMVKMSPFIGIPVLEDWIVDIKTSIDVFLMTDPTKSISSINNIDILQDLIDTKDVVKVFVNATIQNLFRYSTVLTNTSVLLLRDLRSTTQALIKSLQNFILDLTNSNSLVLQHLVDSMTDLWENGWKNLEKDAGYFLDSIELSTVIAKYNFTNALYEELDHIRERFRNVVKKLTNQALNIFSDPDGFGVRLKGELRLFHLKIFGVEIELVYSSNRLGSCGPFSSVYDLLKGEKAVRIKAVGSSGLFKIAPFIRVDVGVGFGIAFSTEAPKRMIAQLHAEAGVLGISGTADLFLTERGHYFFLEGRILNTFKTQLRVAFIVENTWEEIKDLEIEGKLLANAGGGNSFHDSYIDAFRELNRKLADEANNRISQVQNAFSSAQRGITKAQNWLEEKKISVTGANIVFDKAVQAMEQAKQALERAKGPFNNAMNKLNEAQRKVDNICRIRDCHNICVPGLRCSICWKKIWFIKLPYPCCHTTSCMFSFPDPICLVRNVGCRAVRALAYAALEAAKLFVRAPMIALDAAKALVSGAQFVVDKSRVVLEIAKGALDLAQLGLEGAKQLLEGAKIALEAVKKVVGWGLKVVDFVLKYGIQSLIDVRNCGFKATIPVTGSHVVFEVECEINVFRSGFRKVRLGINFGNPIQSIWQAAKGTVDKLVEETRQSERKKRDIRSEALVKLHKIIRETRHYDINDEAFDVLANDTMDTVLYTTGFKENATINDYTTRVRAFKEKCDIFNVVHSFFSKALQILFEMSNDTAHTLNNVSSLEETLTGYNRADLAGNLTIEQVGINADLSMTHFNITVDELNNELDIAKQNLSNDPLLFGIESLSESAQMFLTNQTEDVKNVKIINQWILIMNNGTSEYFTTDECVTFQDCSHFAVFQLYSLFDADNITERDSSLDAISAFEDNLLELIGNISHSIQEVFELTQLMSEILVKIRRHNYFCSEAPRIFSVKANITVTRGDTLSIICNTTGNPQPSIWWYRNNEYLSEQTGQSLLIHNVSAEDSNIYYCVAGNLVANISSLPIEVTVTEEEFQRPTTVSTDTLNTRANNDGVTRTGSEEANRSDAQTERIILLGTTISLFTLVVCTLIVCCKNFRKRNRKPDSAACLCPPSKEFHELHLTRKDVALDTTPETM